eukprot:Pgem_evm1s1389
MIAAINLNMYHDINNDRLNEYNYNSNNNNDNNNSNNAEFISNECQNSFMSNYNHSSIINNLSQHKQHPLHNYNEAAEFNAYQNEQNSVNRLRMVSRINSEGRVVCNNNIDKKTGKKARARAPYDQRPVFCEFPGCNR